MRHTVEFDGGLGVVARVRDGRLEVRTETGTRILAMDDVVRTAVQGGRWSRRGTLEFRLGSGETVAVPFSRENRPRARRLHKWLAHRRQRVEVRREAEEFRRRKLQTIEEDRELFAGRAERGEISPEAYAAFEREAAHTVEQLDRQLRELESTLRRGEDEGPGDA
ncbi:hypothetical protein J4H86_24345 [Spiractinospora alimapuensis]|uniref:hypothetical protein n=1 Tax=Spiractinospora alimapuensis TaxID=2820884 RepID=UPI001F3377A5|nr:hypothetical protein [Spiractinospora alimapuensis]QVQ51855.1 hypothetical protein J4H86_24345 [Spiractinospora alimapuensis]